MVRVERIELSFQAWEAHVLPLHHTRLLQWIRTKGGLLSTVNSETTGNSLSLSNKRLEAASTLAHPVLLT